MQLLNSITNVAKAGIAICVTPLAVVADIFTLPCSAYDDRAPFGKTEKLLKAAGDCIVEAVKPTR